MGKKIQKKYVIVFNSPPEGFEDTLYFFHCDLRERNSAFTAWGITPSYLDKNLRFKKAFCFDEKENFREIEFKSTAGADLVHFLLLNPYEESALHSSLTALFEKKKIAIANPYNKAVADCESKFRTYAILRKNNIPTAQTCKVSKFNKIEKEYLRKILGHIKGRGVFIQPEYGTEGMGCKYFAKNDLEKIFRYIEKQNDDLIIRESIEEDNLKEREYATLRINVVYDGTYQAQSGYAMTGRERVVSAINKARKKNINEFLKERGWLEEKMLSLIKKAACRAVEKIFFLFRPSLLVGVDMVFRENIPYVIDVNPRPVIVGSRTIGEDRINLGEGFCNSILKRWNGKI